MRYRPAAILVTLLATLLAACGTALAGPHEHGRGALQITVADQTLTIALAGPAQDFAGFEHPPATPAETARLAEALDALRAGDALFLAPAEAWCRLVSAAVTPPAPAGDGHAGLEASWRFQCGNAAALLWLETRLFQQFPGIAQLATSIVTPAGRKTVVLTPGTTRALLPRPR